MAHVVHLSGMCRNIRPLHNFEPPASHEEVHDAALQFVRKVSGFTKPSKANEEAFERAVEEITAATTRLLDELVTAAPPKDREVEAAKAPRALAPSATPRSPALPARPRTRQVSGRRPRGSLPVVDAHRRAWVGCIAAMAATWALAGAPSPPSPPATTAR